MISIQSENADEAWRKLADLLRTQGKYQSGRDQPSKELLHVGTTLTDPRQRLVFTRRINPAFAIAEVIWILSGADDLSFVKYWNPRMQLYSDDGVSLCGSYGYRLGSQPKLDAEVGRQMRHWSDKETSADQLRMAYEALMYARDSRQVTLQFWNKNLDMPNPGIRSKDVPCNLVSHLMIRDGKLEWLQVLRSNDLFWGFPYNIIQFTTMQEIMAGWLNIDVGSYVHISDSLHAYQRHWSDLDSVDVVGTIIPHNSSDLRISSYEEWQSIFSILVSCAFQLTRHQQSSDLNALRDKGSQLPRSYWELLAVLMAEGLRKRGMVDRATEMINEAGPFWAASWQKWVAVRSQKILAQ